jgi:hypothetical protein
LSAVEIMEANGKINTKHTKEINKYKVAFLIKWIGSRRGMET